MQTAYTGMALLLLTFGLKAIVLLLKLHLEWSGNTIKQPNVDALA